MRSVCQSLLSLAVLALSQGGCGKSEAPGTHATGLAPEIEYTRVASFRQGLEGSWISRCQNQFSFLDGQPTGRYAGPPYQQARYDFRGNRLTFVVQEFSDFRCSTLPRFLILLEGHFIIRREVPEEYQVKEMTLQFDTCSGVCSQFRPPVSNELYGIAVRTYKIEGRHLYLGVQLQNGTLLWDYNEPFIRSD